MTCPMRSPDLFNHIVLGGRRSPGVVELSGHERPVGWDVKGATAQDGATTTKKGEPLGKFSAKFTLIWDPGTGRDDFAEWVEFKKLIESTTSGETPFALDVYHPDLAANRFTAVTNGGVGEMKHDGKGKGTVEVKFLEFRPPKPKPPKSASGSKNSSNKGKSGAAGQQRDEYDERIEDASEELDELLNG